MTDRPRNARHVHSPDDIPHGAWCWGIERMPHVTTDTQPRDDLGPEVALCDACHRKWLRRPDNRKP